jgi:hypothetical protein
LYEEFIIKLNKLSVEGIKSMDMWQEAIEEERKESLKEGMEMGADMERKAAVEAIAGMVRDFMAETGISSEEAIRRVRVPERYSDSVRAALSSLP